MNPYAADAQPGFYAQLALETGAVSIVDLGCGTGLITCELARRGYRMTGVDPAPAMLDIARLRFRSVEELTGSLADAGFLVERIYGDWDRRPAGPRTRELIVVAA